MALFGPRGYSTIGIGFFFVKIAALLLVACSFLFRKPISHSMPTAATNATVDNYFTGPNAYSFKSNVNFEDTPADGLFYSDPLSKFLGVFSLLFSPFSGLSLGVNLTGETRNPGRAIPRFMLYAVLTCVVCFMSMTAIISSSVWRLWALPNGEQDQIMSLFEKLKLPLLLLPSPTRRQ